MADIVMLESVKAGDLLVADGGFTCIEPAKICEVLADEEGELFVLCCGSAKDGSYSERHYLAGQENDDGAVIGFSRSKAADL